MRRPFLWCARHGALRASATSLAVVLCGFDIYCQLIKMPVSWLVSKCLTLDWVNAALNN